MARAPLLGIYPRQRMHLVTPQRRHQNRRPLNSLQMLSSLPCSPQEGSLARCLPHALTNQRCQPAASPRA